MRRALIFLLPLFLAACGGAEPTWAPESEVQRAIAPNTGPTAITLVTVISNRSGSGAHSGLIIDASQRVLFDPAGTFKHPNMPERNDLHYGVTDKRLEVYYDYHARVTFHVVTERIPVSPAVAEEVMRRAMEYGAVPKANCANSISDILRGVEPFNGLKKTMFPVRLMNEVKAIPGVSERVIYDDDADDNRYVLYIEPEKTAY